MQRTTAQGRQAYIKAIPVEYGPYNDMGSHCLGFLLVTHTPSDLQKIGTRKGESPLGAPPWRFQCQAVPTPLLLVRTQVFQLLLLVPVEPWHSLLQPLHESLPGFEPFRYGVVHSVSQNVPCILNGVEILRGPWVALYQLHIQLSHGS